jgi:hypothetical protein
MPLTDGGVDLTILQPISFGGAWTYTPADRVRYRNHGPWPPQTGSSVTLERRILNGFGDDATNWDVVDSSLMNGVDAYGVVAGAVDLCTFDASPAASGVRVEWVAPALPQGAKYQVLRSRLSDLENPEATGEVPMPKQSPDATGPVRFEWIDETASAGHDYAYQLRIVETDGATRDVALTTTRSQLYMLEFAQIYR